MELHAFVSTPAAENEKKKPERLALAMCLEYGASAIGKTPRESVEKLANLLLTHIPRCTERNELPEVNTDMLDDLSVYCLRARKKPAQIGKFKLEGYGFLNAYDLSR